VSQTIVLSQNLGGGQHGEGVAAGAITPGHCVMQDVNGKLVVQTGAGTGAPAWVAKEDALQGRTIDTAYAVNDPVFYHKCRAGDELNLLIAAGAIAVVLTDHLTYAADGTVKKATGGDALIFKPMEAKDNSGGGAAVRIKARKV